MRWDGIYKAEWRVFEVNPATWADSDLVGGLSSLKVNADAKKDIIETGSMTLTVPVGERVGQRYLRVVMTADSDDGSERADVCTMLWRGTNGTIANGADTRSLVGSSVLYPASRTTLPDMSYAPQNVDGARFAGDMLSKVLVAPVEVTGPGFTLGAPMYFDTDSKVLDAARRLLDAGGYTIQIDGRGTVTLMPMPSTPDLTIGGENARAVSPEVRYTSDTSSMPNRFRAVEGTQQATAENDDPDSEISHQSRGYWDDMVDRSPARVNGETLHSYAVRRLREESVFRTQYSYERRWSPAVHPDSLVRMGLSEMRGDLRVTRQTLTCDRTGIGVQEEAYREEALWQE